MTDEERIKSILSELEHNYISFGNRYNDDAQGMKLIEKALKAYISDIDAGEKRGASNEQDD